jgi:hypothetical protein
MAESLSLPLAALPVAAALNRGTDASNPRV